MRWGWAVVLFLAGCTFCLLLVSLGVVDRVDGVPGTEAEPMLSLPTYLNFVGVMLTAVTVVLAGIAIMIGLVAAYTFRELNDRARETAERAVSEALSDEKLNARIDEASARLANRRSMAELEPDFDPTDDGER